jgi:hypothetical protein
MRRHAPRGVCETRSFDGMELIASGAADLFARHALMTCAQDQSGRGAVNSATHRARRGAVCRADCPAMINRTPSARTLRRARHRRRAEGRPKRAADLKPRRSKRAASEGLPATRPSTSNSYRAATYRRTRDCCNMSRLESAPGRRLHSSTIRRALHSRKQ